MGKPLTNNDIADLYDKKNPGASARATRIDKVMEWAMKQEEIDYDEENDLFYWRHEEQKDV